MHYYKIEFTQLKKYTPIIRIFEKREKGLKESQSATAQGPDGTRRCRSCNRSGH